MFFKLTDVHDPSEHGRVIHRAAVPPPLSELVLALLDARFGSVSDVGHVILVQLAQLPLTLQATQQQRRGEISTDYLVNGLIRWWSQQGGLTSSNC